MSEATSPDHAQAWLVDLTHRHRLSPTQRRVVRYMLTSLPDIAYLSTVEVAEAAGVSQPTVTRLAIALGFSGYPEFRSEVRTVVHGWGRAAGESEPGGLAPTALGSERQNLEDVERTVAGAEMQRAVDLLEGSQPLGIIGLRASSALAEYLGYFARRVLPDVHVLTDAASMDDALLEVSANGARSVLAFVMPRYPSATVQALTHARRLGMSTVAIVDSPLVPFASEVDCLLAAPVGTDLVFDSHAGAVVLAISLLDALAGRDPGRTQERLEAHEDQVGSWEYGDRSGRRSRGASRNQIT